MPIQEEAAMMKRSDGRSSNTTLRPLSCEQSCLDHADGSCLWKSGSTHVLASVHGPMAPRQPQHERGDAAVVTVVIKGTESLDDDSWPAFVTHILTCTIVVNDYPRTVVSVTIQIVQADGSVLAAAVHAALSACLDAGLAMRSLPVAMTCLITTTQRSKEETVVQLDPSADEEEQDGAGVVVIVSESSAHPLSILGIESSSGVRMDTTTLLQCCSLTEKASPAIPAFWRLVLEQQVTRESKTLWSS